MQINVAVTDANNIVCEVVPPQTQTITIDRGVAGNGIVSIVPVTISTFQYLRITYTNGTVQDVGPLTSTAYTATSPITIVGNTISLSTVPIASGGTGATTAATAIQNLLPSYTGNANKRLGLNSGATALEWVLDGGGTVTSINASGGTTGLTFSGGPITTSGTLTLSGTLAVANGGTGVTTSTGTGSVVLSTSPTLVTPALGTPTSGNFSTGTFTWPTFNQNTTGTASNVTGIVAIANGGSGQSTAQLAMNAFAGAVTSGSYLRGNGTNVVMSTIQAADVPTLNQNTTGTAANVTGVVAIANGGTGQTTANTAFNALAPSQTGNSGKFLTTDGSNTSWATNPLGTVTSVAATVPSFLSISGSPITTSGTLAFGLSGTALPTTSGGTGLTSFTSGGIVYASSSSALTTGSALSFNSSINEFSVATGNIKLYSQQNTAGQYRYIGSEYAAGNGNNQAQVRFGIDAGGDTTTFLGFATTNTGGQIYERARIDSSGNLLVGNTDTTSVGVSIFPTGIVRQNTSGTVFSQLRYSGTQIGSLTTDGANIAYNANGVLIFGTGGTTERARIDSSGNFLIGTTSQVSASLFSVRKDQNVSNPLVGIRNATSGSDSRAVYIATSDTGQGQFGVVSSTWSSDPAIPVNHTYLYGSSGLTLYAGSSAYIKFLTNSTEAARITSTGNFGIGISTPQYRLSLGGSTGRKLAIYDDGASGGIASGFGTDLSGSSYELSAWTGGAGGGIGQFTWGQVNTTNGVFAEKMRLDSNGRLGIGTANPAAKLDVTGGSIRVNEDGIGTKTITIRSDWAGVDPAINVTTSNSLLLMTSNTERARITSSGAVGIGTSSPNSIFDVLGSPNRFTVNPTYYCSFSTGLNSYAKRLFGGAVVDDYSYIGDMYYYNSETWITPQTSYAATTYGGGITTFYGGTGVTANSAFYPQERARIDGNGNFTVNYTATTKYVQLQPDGSVRGVHASGGGGDTILGAIYGVSNGYQILVGTNNSQTYKWHIPSQAMTLTSVGNLLIGTTSDQGRRLQVSGAMALVDAALNSIGDMSINSSGVMAIAPYNGNGSAISFSTNPSGSGVTERARITSTGQLLVGTTLQPTGTSTVSERGYSSTGNGGLVQNRTGGYLGSVSNLVLFTRGNSNAQAWAFITISTIYATPSAFVSRTVVMVRGDMTYSVVSQVGDSSNGYNAISFSTSGNDFRVSNSNGSIYFSIECELGSPNNASYGWNATWGSGW